MSDVLSRICDAKRREVASLRASEPTVDPSGAPPPRPVAWSDFGMIAEVKRSSPSAGTIDDLADPVAQAVAYAAAGAVAVSVLTESDWFGGSLEDLTAVSRAVDVPVLRKDFVIDSWQIAESRRAGADLVLLIVAALEDVCVPRFADETRDLGMTPLVEVHSVEELPVALEAISGGGLLGVNSRNLRTLEIDLAVWEEVAPHIPQGVTAVAESGVRTPADVARAAAAGYDGVLCGEVLMRSPDPGALLSDLAAAARQ